MIGTQALSPGWLLFVLISLFVLGLSISGTYLAGGDILDVSLFLSIVGTTLFFCEEHLMKKSITGGHIKNQSSGLHIQLKQAVVVINFIMLFFGILVGFLSSWIAACAYFLCTSYLWLSHRHFLLGQEQFRSPWVLMALSQLVLIPVVAFPLLVVTPFLVYFPETVYFGLMIFGVSVTYGGICKSGGVFSEKSEAPVQSLFLTLFIVLIGSILSAFFAWKLNLQLLSWPILLAVFLFILFFCRKRPEITRRVALISVVIHAWSPAIMFFQDVLSGSFGLWD